MNLKLALFYLSFFSNFAIYQVFATEPPKNVNFQSLRKTFSNKTTQMQNLVLAARLQNQAKINNGSITPVERLKVLVRLAFRQNVGVCLKRFQKCSEHLSPSFCASTTENITFYIWARQLAADVMNGHGVDQNKNVKCSKELLRNFLVNARFWNI